MLNYTLFAVSTHESGKTVTKSGHSITGATIVARAFEFATGAPPGKFESIKRANIKKKNFILKKTLINSTNLLKNIEAKQSTASLLKSPEICLDSLLLSDSNNVHCKCPLPSQSSASLSTPPKSWFKGVPVHVRRMLNTANLYKQSNNKLTGRKKKLVLVLNGHDLKFNFNTENATSLLGGHGVLQSGPVQPSEHRHSPVTGWHFVTNGDASKSPEKKAGIVSLKSLCASRSERFLGEECKWELKLGSFFVISRKLIVTSQQHVGRTWKKFWCILSEDC